MRISKEKIEFQYQSNSLEYTVFANASRLKAAESGSKGFVMFPSGVTMTRWQSECSSDFTSHLRRILKQCKKGCAQNMKF